jgi:hypothetical protein
MDKYKGNFFAFNLSYKLESNYYSCYQEQFNIVSTTKWRDWGQTSKKLDKLLNSNIF